MKIVKSKNFLVRQKPLTDIVKVNFMNMHMLAASATVLLANAAVMRPTVLNSRPAEVQRLSVNFGVGCLVVAAR